MRRWRKRSNLYKTEWSIVCASTSASFLPWRRLFWKTNSSTCCFWAHANPGSLGVFHFLPSFTFTGSPVHQRSGRSGQVKLQSCNELTGKPSKQSHVLHVCPASICIPATVNTLNATSTLSVEDVHAGRTPTIKSPSLNALDGEKFLHLFLSSVRAPQTLTVESLKTKPETFSLFLSEPAARMQTAGQEGVFLIAKFVYFYLFMV